MATGKTHDRALRIVTFNILSFAYRVVADWATKHGHELTLLVTTPGPKSRRGTAYRETIAQVPPTQEVAVTTRVARLAPYLAALEPDLLVSFTFPYLIPPEIIALPRLGALNLHPTPCRAIAAPTPFASSTTARRPSARPSTARTRVLTPVRFSAAPSMRCPTN